MHLQNNKYFQAQRKVYLVFGIVCGLPLLFLLLVLYTTLSTGLFDSGLLKVIIAWIGGTTVTFFWLKFFKIELSDESISYRTIWKLGKTSSLAFSEISKAEIKIGVFKYTDRFKPTVRLELKPKPRVNKPPIIINLKVFSENDLKILFSFLESKGIRVPE